MISADRSKRGILFPDTPAFSRQASYANKFGNLVIIGFSRRSDGARPINIGPLRVHPTNSSSRFLYGWDAIWLAQRLPKPDVVSVQDPFETGIVGWWIARKLKVPLHVQVHTDFLSPEYAKLSLLNRFRVLVARLVLRRAARIRVVSERIKRTIESRYHTHAPIIVLPIFADVGRLASLRSDLGNPQGSDLENRFEQFKFKLLVVARLEPEKNVALAIEAFAKSAPENACLIVVGTGSENMSLQRFAKRWNVADRVFFEDPSDIRPFYKVADLLLVLSKYEGYGLVIVEALAAGKPVLSTDIGIAREAGAIVTTEEQFADALSEWFKSGPRMGVLKNYPYKNFDEYVRAYCDDIKRCATAQ